MTAEVWDRVHSRLSPEGQLIEFRIWEDIFRDFQRWMRHEIDTDELARIVNANIKGEADYYKVMEQILKKTYTCQDPSGRWIQIKSVNIKDFAVINDNTT